MSLRSPRRTLAGLPHFVALAVALLVTTAQDGAAQTVSSLFFDDDYRMDGLHVAPTGGVYATSGFLGGDVYRVSGGVVDTVATGVGGPIHVLATRDGRLLTTAFREREVSQIVGDGTLRTFATVADGPSDLIEGPDGSIYVTQYGDPSGFGDGDSVTRIHPDGTVEDFAVGGDLRGPVGIAIDDEGYIYVANIFDGRITKLGPDGSQTAFASLPLQPPLGSLTVGHMVWTDGSLYATYLSNHQVVAFATDGTMRVVAGTGQPGRDDGPAGQATFTNPNGLGVSASGDTLYVSEYLLSDQSVPVPTDRLRVIHLE
ncbi:virginiamycin B lyase family protein [Rubrivirga sp.]|uniref:Vgb family protein n=1 Tax=Rubrivirga sp. TaxID=1885344 RepID=UPI003C765EC1